MTTKSRKERIAELEFMGLSVIQKLEAKIKQVHEIAMEAPELNMSNYDHNDVRDLNEAMIEIFLLTKPVNNN